MAELRLIQYQHNASIIAKIYYAKPKFNSNKRELIDLKMKAYRSITKPNQTNRIALTNALFEAQRAHTETPKQLMLHGITCQSSSM